MNPLSYYGGLNFAKNLSRFTFNNRLMLLIKLFLKKCLTIIPKLLIHYICII